MDTHSLMEVTATYSLITIPLSCQVMLAPISLTYVHFDTRNKLMYCFVQSFQNQLSNSSFRPCGIVFHSYLFVTPHILLAGVHKIFFVWYPTFSPKNLSYEMRDCYYQKMRQKSRYKMEYKT